MMSPNVTLIAGDGEGPAIAALVQEAVAAAGGKVSWEAADAADPEAMIASIKANGVALKAKFMAAKPVGKVPYVIHLRKSLGIHTILRRCHNVPGLPARAQGVDIMIVREASEDIYAGFEHQTSEGVFETVKVTTRASCERISRTAFEYARKNGRKKVTTVHKSNILKKADGMFLRVSQQIAAEYPDIQHDEVIVDALCMKLVRWPQDFDVLLCGNLFGDIVSDCAAGMAGGTTVATGVNLGDGVVMFENPHPSSSPYPMLRLAVDLLDHLNQGPAARRLQSAIEGALKQGVHSAEMGGKAGTADVRTALLSLLSA